MSDNANTNDPSRRDFLKQSTAVAGASVLMSAASTAVGAYAGESNTVNVALIGCGGRGTGAADNALSVKNGPVRLLAMADVFDRKLQSSHRNLARKHGNGVDVPQDRRFIGFDGYRKAMDCLNPGDVAIFATPPAFRWVHFSYAVEKGLNVFMEKPVTVDGPTSKKMFKLGEESVKKGMKVGVGLMCRHCKARGELYDRIKDGQIGDVLELRAYRLAGPTASAASGPKPDGESELHYQIRRFHSFLWLSGGAFSDFLIHNLDEACWMKDAWPVKAEGSGGRHYRLDNVDQNFDNYNVEYTFEDGTKLFLRGRTIPGCYNKFASFAHGTKGLGVISTAGHVPARSRIYKGYTEKKENLLWAHPQPEPNPYQLEWDHLIAAIRNNETYNEVQRGVEASLITSMGRMACHTGREITREEILNCDHEFAPNVDALTLKSDAPLKANKEGKYPVPLPGINRRREY